mgnify:CR=1 FL=1
MDQPPAHVGLRLGAAKLLRGVNELGVDEVRVAERAAVPVAPVIVDTLNALGVAAAVEVIALGADI